MKYPIKRLKSSSAKAIASMVSHLLAVDFPQYKPETIAQYQKIYNSSYFRQTLQKSSNIAFGMFDGKSLIAAIVIKCDYGGVIFIDWLGVDSHYRRQGLGSLLLDQARKWAQKHHYHYAYLLTESDSNIAYYKKRGFVHIGSHINSWFGETEHIMSQSYNNF